MKTLTLLALLLVAAPVLADPRWDAGGSHPWDAAAPPREFKQTYEDARAKALRDNLPLVVWSGTAVCPACVNTLAGECVSYVGRVNGLPDNAMTIGIPDGKGEVWIRSIVTDWLTGHSVYGHVPSIRRAVQRFRETGYTSSGGWSMELVTAPVQPQRMSFLPVAMRGRGC